MLPPTRKPACTNALASEALLAAGKTLAAALDPADPVEAMTAEEHQCHEVADHTAKVLQYGVLLLS